MPIETVLPPPQVEWWTEAYYPTMPATPGLPQNYNANNYAVRGGRNFIGAGPTTTNNLSWGSVGGTGVLQQYVQQSTVGRAAHRGRSSSAVWGQGWVWPWWVFQGDAGDPAVDRINPGYSEFDAYRIAWIRFGWLQGAVDATLGVGTGLYFVGWNGDATVTVTNRLPGGAGFGGGVGVVGDGAGGLQYVSHSGAGALLEAVPIPASAIPDLTAWSTIDFVFRSSISGAPGWLSLIVNGVTLVEERPFGPLLVPPRLLTYPGTANQGWTYSLIFGSLNPGSNTALEMWWWGRWGKFRPDGREVS